MADETNNVPTDGATFDVGAAFFGPAATPEVLESDENGAGTQPEIAEATGIDASDDGTEDAGIAGEGEAVDPDVWEFNGSQFTGEQVSAALKHQETYERFNTTIPPLIDNIKAFGQTAERLQTMAQTETEKQIAELQGLLRSGKLDASRYQQVHQQLQSAELRMDVLKQAAVQEETTRKQALQHTRTHNARLVATNLVKSGWTKDAISEAQALAQQCMTPDTFADSLSIEFMEVLRDAAELRRTKANAAKQLQDKATKAVKVGSTSARAAVQKVKKSQAGDADWMSKNFWGGKR